MTLPPLPPRAWLRYDLVDRLVTRLAPTTILEIGCGQGAFGARLAARARYLAVEPDPVSAALARPRIAAAGGRLVRGTHEAVPAGAQYDLVCAFEVLEHLEDDAGALVAWAELVRPGGHLLLSVPAWQQRFGPMDVHAGHYRRYSPDRLAELLLAAGLVGPEVTVYGWPLGYALEAVRNPVAARSLAAASAASSASGGAGPTIEERTAASGRILQPARPWVGAGMAAAMLPFRYLQRATPRRGTGLVALAARAADGWDS